MSAVIGGFFPGFESATLTINGTIPHGDDNDDHGKGDDHGNGNDDD